MPIILDNFVNKYSQFMVRNKHTYSELKAEPLQENKSIYLYYNENIFWQDSLTGRATMIALELMGVLRKNWNARLWCGF